MMVEAAENDGADVQLANEVSLKTYCVKRHATARGGTPLRPLPKTSGLMDMTYGTLVYVQFCRVECRQHSDIVLISPPKRSQVLFAGIKAVISGESVDETSTLPP